MKFNLNFKIKVVTEYLSGIGSTTLARKYAIANKNTVLIWINRFKKFGIEGLKPKSMDLEYSSQFKIDVLNWRKQHLASLPTTALHFDLSSPSTIWQWERRFERYGISGLDRKRGNPKTMAKHKKISNDEKSVHKDELKQLKQENLMLKIENEYLKKIEALARQKSAQKKTHNSSQN